MTILDHHSASEQFMMHMKTEMTTRGGISGDWVWLVPPMSGSLCPVFHQELALYKMRPSYEYQVERFIMLLTTVYKNAVSLTPETYEAASSKPVARSNPVYGGILVCQSPFLP